MYRLTRWNPVREFSALNRAMNRLLDDEILSMQEEQPAHTWGLALDVVEKDQEFIVKASVPGIHPDDLSITLDDSVLTVQGEHKVDETIKEDDFRLRERRYGRFSRSVRFPVEVNGEAIEATYAHGVLTLVVPKAEAVQPRRITIRATDAS